MNKIYKLKRYYKIIKIIYKYGFKEAIYNILSNKGKIVFNSEINKKIRMMIEELGPTYIKIAQFLSTREDLIPLSLINELKLLQSNVAVNDNLYDIKNEITKNFNLKIDDYFNYINNTPICAGSISKVYEGILKNGDKVIIKIKHDNIEKIIKYDIEILKDIIKLLESKNEYVRNIYASDILDSFKTMIYEELSFENEIKNMEKFKLLFKFNNDIYIPKIYNKLCNSNIICMERIYGEDIYQLKKNNSIDYISRSFKILCSNYIEQIIKFGFFHADPQFGNIIFMKYNKICFIDFGAMGNINKNHKKEIENIVINFSRNNTSNIIKSIKKITIKNNICDEEKLENEIDDLIEYVKINNSKYIKLNIIIKIINKILKNNKLLLPNSFYILMRSLSMLESISKILNQNLNIDEIIKPHTISVIKSRIHPNYISNKLIDKLINLDEDIDHAINNINQILNKINNEKLKINIDLKIKKEIKTSSNKISLSIIILSILISSSILIGKKVIYVKYLGFLLLFIGLFLILNLVYIIKKNRD